MTEGLRVSKDLTLPLESATWTFAVLAIKGAGKTYDSADLAEEMIKAGIPIVVIDGMGIWWGLRVGVDGHDGLPIVVFGGQHKDLPLPMKQIDLSRQAVDEDKLRLMVKAILEARISAVLDTSELSKGMQRRVVATFVNELNRLNANFGVRHVFIEEADMWCPQRGLTGDVAVSTGAIDDLVRRGGNWNLGCTLITQRSAVLNKDVLTQANCLIVLRILHQLDKNAVRTWVESVVHPDDPKILKWYDSLRELENGEAYVWHPENPEIFKRIKFRKRETLHATREYFRKVQTAEIEKVDVTEFIEKFRKIFEPKPKPQEIKQPLPVTHVETTIHEIRPVYPDRRLIQDFTPQPLDTVTVDQILPEVILRKTRPTVEVSPEPHTPVGRVLVVLMNHEGRDDRWTGAKIKTLIRDHAWPDDGAEDGIDALLRWEILRKQSNNYLRFYRERVKIVEQACIQEVA